MSRHTHTLPVLGAAVVLGLGGAAVADASAGGHASRSRVTATDKQYLQTSIEGDRFEIRGGRTAQKRPGASDAVRAYGARLVSDHSKSLAESIALAKSLGIQVPVAPQPPEQWELQTVGGFRGRKYDHAYADLEAKDHQQDISEAQDEVSDGTNAKIRANAKQALPMLRTHLRIALKLGGKKGRNPLP